MRQLDFGVFDHVDHVDRGGRTVKEVFDLRMRLIETYEAAGFHAYHPAEHHSTPLSCLPSPNLLIAVWAQPVATCPTSRSRSRSPCLQKR